MCISTMVNERFDLVLEEKLAKRFREIALKRGNHKKGALSIAFAQAIHIWINNPSHLELSKKSKNRARRSTKR